MKLIESSSRIWMDNQFLRFQFHLIFFARVRVSLVCISFIGIVFICVFFIRESRVIRAIRGSRRHNLNHAHQCHTCPSPASQLTRSDHRDTQFTNMNSLLFNNTRQAFARPCLVA